MSKALIIPIVQYIPAAIIDGGPYLVAWSASSSDAPTDYYITGTDISLASVTFPSSSSRAMSTTFRLPGDTYLAAGVGIKICWSSSVSSGNVVWNVKSGFAADDSIVNPPAPTFNTAQVINASPSSNIFGRVSSTLASLTTTSGAAGSDLFIKLIRPASSSDTIASSVWFYGMEVTYSRLVTLT